MAKFTTIEEYLASFPPDVREVLEQIRSVALAAVPGGEDAIRYDIGTVVTDGHSVVHYAGWKSHVSLYPVPADPELADDVAPYLSGRSTLKLPLSKPVPYDLVRRVVEALVAGRG